jgi:predicted O-methyltransferase YrrM
MLRKAINRTWGRLGFRPAPAQSVGTDTLIQQAAQFFRLPEELIRREYETYERFYEQQRYRETLGEQKTLYLEEAFLVYLAAWQMQPKQVVEIGTQYGKSARRIVDMLKLLGLESQVTCFDVMDEIQFVGHEDVELVLHDLTHDFSSRVLEQIAPTLIFLDARPYHLLQRVIRDFLDWSKSHPAILAIHDCAPGLYNPRMKISKNDPSAPNSQTGIWERHVLADIFSVPNSELDEVQTENHRLKIFGTLYGLALIAPNYLKFSATGAEAAD